MDEALLGPLGLAKQIKENSSDWLLNVPVLADKIVYTVRALADQQQALSKQQLKEGVRRRQQQRK